MFTIDQNWCSRSPEYAVTATTTKGAIKTWASIDSSAKWIKSLGIGKAQLEISKWLPGQRGMVL